MKLAQLVSGLEALRKLQQSVPPARLAFRFLRIWDWAEPILRRYEEQRVALLRRCARGEDEPGVFHFRNDDGTADQEAVARFLAEHAELLDEEISDPPARLTVEELEQFNAGLTVAEIASIRWMVDAGEDASAR